jgi:hypothetical protein
VELAKKELKGKPLSTIVWKTSEGFDTKPIYTAADTAGKTEELPGVPPRVLAAPRSCSEQACSPTRAACTPPCTPSAPGLFVSMQVRSAARDMAYLAAAFAGRVA